MSWLAPILAILKNITGLINKTPDREVKRRQAAKSDVLEVEYNQDELTRKYKFIKKHAKLLRKARGEKTGWFRKKEPLIKADETIPQVYDRLIKELEGKK